MTDTVESKRAKAVLLASDFEYYAPRCLKIKTKAGEIVPFIPNRAQRYLHEKVEEQRRATGKVRVLNLKGRQQGMSTYWEGRFYWRTSMNRGKRAYILTHEQAATDNLFAMTGRFHDNCPEALRPTTRNHSAKALTFDKLDSEFSVATAGSKDTGRSGTGQYFHGSEVAFWANAVDHMAGIGQTIPNEPGTEIALESTGNGVGNVFHGMWGDAIRGESDYIPVFIPWFWQLEYTETAPDGWAPDAGGVEYLELYGITRNQAYWRERKIKTDFRGDTNLFDQEYPATAELAFRRQSVESLISLAKIERAMKQTGLEAVGPKIMAVDPAEYGDDDTLIGYRQGRVVPETRRFHKRGPMEVVALAAKAFDDWQPDFLNVDAGGLGSGIADRLAELGYPVNRVLFGERAYEADLYAIRKDEMGGLLKEWFDDEPVQLPYDEALKADLSGPSFTYDSSRRLKVESKEHMKDRGLKSPDGFDMLCLTHAVPVMATLKSGTRSLSTPNWRAL